MVYSIKQMLILFEERVREHGTLGDLGTLSELFEMMCCTVRIQKPKGKKAWWAKAIRYEDESYARVRYSVDVEDEDMNQLFYKLVSALVGKE